jgi:uncharacterized protein YggT (Ycf19 family)
MLDERSDVPETPAQMEVREIVQPARTVREVRTLPTTRYRAIHVVWFLAGLIDVIVGLRFLLKLFGAAPAAPFVSLVYGISEPLVAPFRGIFPTTGQGAFVLEPASLVAILIYPLIAAGIVGIVRILSGRQVSDR